METAHLIGWDDAETHLLLNPRLPATERAPLERLAASVSLEAHVWLASSGTSGTLKLVALSKQALLASAAAVNRHLASSGDDVWLKVLPSFHVGGLGIDARGHLSGARVVSAPWDPRLFDEICRSEGVTLSSLVPAQVSDLVTSGIAPAASLRAVIVGGGALSSRLAEAARGAGWPLRASYGMTECASQIATAKEETGELVLLDHLEAQSDAEGRLAFRGPSLLTGYATAERGFFDPKIDGWFVSEDLGEVEGRVLRIFGRRGDFVKIGGESVDLSRLQRILEEIGSCDAAIMALPDERLGHVIALAIASGDAESVRAAFDARVLPFERIRRIVAVASIPRSVLGKILRARLLETIG